MIPRYNYFQSKRGELGLAGPSDGSCSPRYSFIRSVRAIIPGSGLQRRVRYSRGVFSVRGGCLWACPRPGLESVSDSSASDAGLEVPGEEERNAAGFGPPPARPGARWSAAL